jgi:uncharacterized protein (DUF58 family)
MNSPSEALHHIRRLQIKALRNVEDLFAGIYRSAFKGKGLEFEDVREYAPGDDIRSIDWNVTARSQKPYVKNFREERELTVMLIVDVSASSQYSHTSRFKSELIAELAALLAFSAIKNQDKVGLLLFSNEIELYLKPKKGISHVLRVIRELLYFKPKHEGTDLPQALSFLGRVQKKHTISFLISDFLTANFSRQASVTAKRHELIAFHVYDSFEREFAPKGLFSLHDLESRLQAVIDTADPSVRKEFENKAKKQSEEVKKLIEKAGASYYPIHTGENSADALQRFFRLRGKK